MVFVVVVVVVVVVVDDDDVVVVVVSVLFNFIKSVHFLIKSTANIITHSKAFSEVEEVNTKSKQEAWGD